MGFFKKWFKRNKTAEELADESYEQAESQAIANEERRQELERHGYSSEEDYADAYYAGETGAECGEPPVYEPDLEDEPSNNQPDDGDTYDDYESGNDDDYGSGNDDYGTGNDDEYY